MTKMVFLPIKNILQKSNISHDLTLSTKFVTHKVIRTEGYGI